jgi:hypothetical protein
MRRLGPGKVLIVVLLLVSAIYVAAITPSSFGFYLDDGIYMVKAKALATGRGYRILSLPGEPVDAKSPPVYPLLLSLLWRVFPAFPGNLTAMMMMSAFTGMVSLVIVFRYLTRFQYARGWQALIIVAFAGLNWRQVILASSVYSETTYTLLSIAALYFAEWYAERGRWVSGLFTGLMLGFACLTRMAGLTLIIAAAVFWFQQRKFRRAAFPLAVSLAMVVGWTVWVSLNSTGGAAATAGYYEGYLSTFANVVSRATSLTHESSLRVVLGIVGRNAVMMVLLSPPLMCLGLPYDWGDRFSGPLFGLGAILLSVSLIMIGSGFLKTGRRFGTWRLTQIYVVAYLVFHLAWPYDNSDRFLIPLLPFLFLFLVNGLTVLVRLVRTELAARGSIIKRSSAASIALCLLALTAAWGYVNFIGIRGAIFLAKSYWGRRASQDSRAVSWIKGNTSPSDVLMCPRDTSYFLYSGRKSVLSFPLREGAMFKEYQAGDIEAEESILRLIRETDPGYLIVTSAELSDTGFVYYRALSPLIEHHPETLALVFRSDDSEISVYKIRNHSVDTGGQTDTQGPDSAAAIVGAQREKQREILVTNLGIDWRFQCVISSDN